MATENITITRSDLSGKSEAKTIAFGLKGTWYEIDLTPGEEDGLQGALEQYLAAARKASANPSRKGQSVPKMSQSERDEIRAWAAKNELSVPAKGRLPKAVLCCAVSG